MTHSKAYFRIRSIVRFIVGFVLVAAVFIGIHLAAISLWTALPVSLVLTAVFLVISSRQNARRA